MPTLKVVTPSENVPVLEVKEDRREALEKYLERQLDDAFAARHKQEQTWQEAMRLYNGIPKLARKNFPIENAPNFEVVLGAIAADTIYAQFIDLIFSVNPIVTARGIRKRFVDDDTAKEFTRSVQDLQEWINYLVANKIRLRSAAEHTLLDDCQLGTGFYYIPWVNQLKRTKVTEIVSRGPIVFSMPTEDVLAPGGKGVDIQWSTWLALRFWLDEDELNEHKDEWRTGLAQPVGNKDLTSSRREQQGKTADATRQQGRGPYEIFDIYVLWDIDGDGKREDLLVKYDRGSKKILKEEFNPYDHRPVEKMCYQIRAHLFYGLGVVEMVKPFEDETTETHNERLLNLKLANTRMYKARYGAIQSGTVRAWTGRVLEMSNPEDVQEFGISDIYNSNPQAEAISTSLAERRVGINDIVQPRASQVIGSRTPGVTAQAFIQQANKRFTPAFDQGRFATAGAVRQALYRYQERLLAADVDAIEEIMEVLGEEAGGRVIGLLKDKKFDNAVQVELTASSATANRDVDRQNAIFLVNLLASYYERSLNLIAIAANPQTSPEVSAVARKIADAATQIIDRTVRTFDQIRDPQDFIIDMDKELDQIQVTNEVVTNLQNLLGGALTNTAAQGAVADVATS